MMKVTFVGYGEKIIRTVLVKADTYEQAFDEARAMYKYRGWKFDWSYMEVEDV
jgi:hypothetical protein